LAERAVITGVGVVSAFGVGAPAFFDGLAAGRGAVRAIRWFDAQTFPSSVAGEVPILAPSAAALAAAGLDDAPLPRWEQAGLLRDRKVGFALLAAREAWLHAGCGPGERGAGLSLALGLEQAFLEDFHPFFAPTGAFDWAAEPAAPLPAVRIRSQVDAAARLVEAYLELRGPVAVHVSACAAGGMAVAHAAALVARGEADLVLAGGADSMVNPLGLGGMARLGALSPRSAPDACRPFDARRDGLAVGEGAAVFVVEAEGRARARGARPLLRLLGAATTQDAFRATAPRPDGAAARAALIRALGRGGIAPEAVGYVNAHGTGTPLNDAAETLALRGALGAHADHVAVSSIKGAVGHLMAAAGAIELAACLLPGARGLLPGTANHREPDPACALDVIGEAPRPAGDVEIMLSNSFGFGGQNVTLVVGRVP
jgi:3-oxoacyl-(acyl-carrier-protein) synthase